jgi:Uma2 family endonuclease
MATATLKHRRPSIPLSLSLQNGVRVQVPAKAFTYKGFRDWVLSPEFPENVRAAFLDREIFLDMSNEDPELHVAVKGEVFAALRPIVRVKKLGRIYTDGVLVSNEDAEVSNNPDASLLSYKSLRSGKVQIVERDDDPSRYREFVGSPDWVLEVISDSSVEKDTERLMSAYHRAGISEYWLIDARGEEIEFTIYHWRKAGYVTAPNQESWQKSKVFGGEFRLTRERDEFGYWEYTLEVR